MCFVCNPIGRRVPGLFVGLCKLILSRNTGGRPAGLWTRKLSGCTPAGPSSLRQPIAEARGLALAPMAVSGLLGRSRMPDLTPPFRPQPPNPGLLQGRGGHVLLSTSEVRALISQPSPGIPVFLFLFFSFPFWAYSDKKHSR